MKVALIHDWLIQEGGAEKVFREIYKLYPGEIYTLFRKDSLLTKKFSPSKIRSSWLNYLPRSHLYYRNLLPLFPIAIKSLDLSEYDVLLSSSHCMAKNVKKQPHQTHICYCHTPARYLWDQHVFYQSHLSALPSTLFRLFSPYLQKEDLSGSQNVDLFIANSHFVKERIQIYYQREAKVIYPPIDTEFFYPIGDKKEDYYITCSRLIPYKNIDLLLEAFSKFSHKKLLVIGEGPMRDILESKAPSNVKFLGWVNNELLRSLLQKATAFLYAAVEDFGMILAEAIASGCPVIALGQGGAKEIVMPESGILFDEASTNSLAYAINQLEKQRNLFDPFFMHQSVKRFSSERFAMEFVEVVNTSIHLSRR